MPAHYSRREVLKATVGVVAAAALGDVRLNAAAPVSPTDREKFKAISDQLTRYMTDLVSAAKVKVAGNRTLLMSTVSSAYVGIWPDDTLYPLMAVPALAVKEELAGQLALLTESIVTLPYVPDRVEPDGLPVLSPGGTESSPISNYMALHLPAAWVRLLDYYQSFGVTIPRKEEWARVIARSFNQVPFSCGLAYSDPQKSYVGFGFHDSVRITGFELMSSLMLYRGLQRAARLFHDSIEPSTLTHWTQTANGIRANLYRFYDANIGGYMGGTRSGHQFSVWANGLAYSLADTPTKAKIVQFYHDNRDKIFLLGCTRQIAEPSWQNTGGAGSYQNGGFWGTGTGYVLPALADQDPAFALELAAALADNLTKINYAEWIAADGSPHGAPKFLGSVSLPLIGLRSILENKPLIEYF